MKAILRTGDKVTISGTVRYNPSHDGQVFVTYDESEAGFVMVPQSAVIVTQAKIEVGDRIRICRGSGEQYDVVLIEGDAMVCRSEFGHLTILSQASYSWERVPPVDEIAEIAASMGETKRLEEERATDDWRIQQEADGSWSVYEGDGFRRGRLESEAEAYAERDKLRYETAAAI